MKQNPITVLPNGISTLKNIKVLDLMDTKIKFLPEEVGELDCLTTLILANTCIDSLPKSISKLPHLSKLSFCLKNLEVFPIELSKSISLKTIDTRICSFRFCVKKEEDLEEEDAFRNLLRASLPNCKVY